MAGEQTPERLPLPGVAHALVDTALRESRSHGRDRDPALVEHGHRLGEAEAACAEQILRGHPAVDEGQRSGVGRTPPHLGVGRRHRETGRAGGHHDRGDLPATVRQGARDGGDRHQTRDAGARVGDEALLAVQYPGVAVEDRGGAERPGVGAPLGSVIPSAASASPAHRAGSQRRFCSGEPNRWMGRAPRETPAESATATEESIRASSSSARHRLGSHLPRHRAPRRRRARTGPSGPGPPRAGREVTPLVEFTDDGCHLVTGEGTDCLPQQFLLVRQPEVDHGAPSREPVAATRPAGPPGRYRASVQAVASAATLDTSSPGGSPAAA